MIDDFIPSKLVCFLSIFSFTLTGNPLFNKSVVYFMAHMHCKRSSHGMISFRFTNKVIDPWICDDRHPVTGSLPHHHKPAFCEN